MSSKKKSTAKKDDASPALIPKLRFPEFRGDGEWVSNQLGDVASVLMCKRIFANETNPVKGVPFYKIGTLGTAPDAFIAQELFEDYKTRYNYPRVGEVLITCSGTIGKCLPYDGRDAYFQDSNIVWIDNPTLEVSNEFLLNILATVNWGRLNSTTITRIYGPDLRDLAIRYPRNPTEQQRIASCLSSLDSLITAHTQKLSALKTYKKGLMQALFPREGETVPRLRFPEFRGKGEWEEKRLGDVANLRNGYAFKSTEYVDRGAYKIITIANVQQGILALDSTKSIAALPPDIQPHQVLSPGDILISMTGNVGRICRVNAEGLLLNQRVGRLTPTAIDDSFFYQLLQRDDFRNTMQLKAAGGAQGNLSGGDIAEFGFTIPKEPEQQKISSCLSSLDDIIVAQTQKIEALKIHKKGLMQGLFPSPEERNTL